MSAPPRPAPGDAQRGRADRRRRRPARAAVASGLRAARGGRGQARQLSHEMAELRRVLRTADRSPRASYVDPRARRRRIVPIRSTAPASASSLIRRRSPPGKTSLTTSGSRPRRRAGRRGAKSAAASISTARAPAASQRVPGAGVDLVEEVGAGDQDRPRPPFAVSRACRRPIRAGNAVGAEGAADAVLGQGRLGAEQVSERESLVEPAAGADPNRPAHAQAGELLEHDRRAGRPHARRLDAQRPARLGLTRVPPQPPVVVAHPRLGQQLLGQRQGPPRVAGQEGVGRVGCLRPKMVGGHAASIDQ